MQEEHVIDLLPAYAIGCLDGEDNKKVENHLESCDCCRSGLEAYSRVMDDLPLRIALSEPPGLIREKILQRIQQEGWNDYRRIKSARNPSRARWAVLLWMALSGVAMFVSILMNWSLWKKFKNFEQNILRA